MKASSLALLLALPLLAVPAPAAATHCAGALPDDGTHSVSQTGLVVAVNGVGVLLDCFGFRVTVSEVLVLDPAVACRAPRLGDDGVHSVTESGGTVHVNGASWSFSCLGLEVLVPETFYLP